MIKTDLQKRKILHMDLDAFFCAVEELENPALKNSSFAVGGDPNMRGVVSSCSYSARQKGIHSAMPMSQAVKIDPGLVIISPNHKKYAEKSKQVMHILEDFTGIIEQVSIDEAFLDVSDMSEEAEVIAKSIQQRIKTILCLPTSFGVASNKLVAKIANDYGKKQHRGNSYPEKITNVPLGNEKDFLAPLLVDRLWGVGEKTKLQLRTIGINTIGQLAASDPNMLKSHFGKNGIFLHRHANGIDERPMETGHERKSLSQETTFSKDISSEKYLRTIILQLSEKIGSNLRHEGLCILTIRIKYRYSDFSTFTRQVTMLEPTYFDSVLFDHAWGLFKKYWDHSKPIRLIGVGVSNFSEYFHQPSLLEVEDNKDEKLLSALDQIKDKYGNEIIKRAAYIQSKPKPDKKKELNSEKDIN